MQYAVIPTTNKAPEGWLFCDGKEYFKTEFPDLFALIGNTFGVSKNDPANKFLVPNFVGRVAVGAAASTTGTEWTVAQTGGNETHQLTEEELASHCHSGTTTQGGGTHTHQVNDPGHSHIITTLNKDYDMAGGHVPPAFGIDATKDDPVIWDKIVSNERTGITIPNGGGAHTHEITTKYTGEGKAFSLMQPYLVVSYIIKT